MPELLERGGSINLWSEWSLTLPPSHYQRNDDGSWSAWGADWVVDVTIIDVGGDPDGKPVPAEALLGGKQPNASGSGWIGHTEVLTEKDGDRDVFRLTASLASTNTLMSCCVSYLSQPQHGLANALVQSVAHK